MKTTTKLFIFSFLVQERQMGQRRTSLKKKNYINFYFFSLLFKSGPKKKGWVGQFTVKAGPSRHTWERVCVVKSFEPLVVSPEGGIKTPFPLRTWMLPLVKEEESASRPEWDLARVSTFLEWPFAGSSCRWWSLALFHQTKVSAKITKMVRLTYKVVYIYNFADLLVLSM